VVPSIRKKLALTSQTSGGRSVGIVRLRTEATEFFIINLHIINRPVFYLKHDVSEIDFRLLLQVKQTQLYPIDRTHTCSVADSGHGVNFVIKALTLLML
jgi:hypothetical protein